MYNWIHEASGSMTLNKRKLSLMSSMILMNLLHCGSDILHRCCQLNFRRVKVNTLVKERWAYMLMCFLSKKILKLERKYIYQQYIDVTRQQRCFKHRWCFTCPISAWQPINCESMSNQTMLVATMGTSSRGTVQDL